jgi:hypothetical protein
MVDGTPKLEPGSEVAMTRPAPSGRAGNGGARMRIPADAHGLPASPPPEVLAAVEQVSRGLDELARQRLSLRFSLGSDAQMRVLVQQPGGRVVKEIPVSTALDLLESDPGAFGEG